MYDYECSHCLHRDAEFQKMSSEPLRLCPKCGLPTYEKQVSLTHTDMKAFHTPIDMLSVAVNSDDEIADLRRRVPGIQISSDPADPNYGVPVANTRKEKLAILKASGFAEVR